jgi:hypothetical protein
MATSFKSKPLNFCETLCIEGLISMFRWERKTEQSQFQTDQGNVSNVENSQIFSLNHVNFQEANICASKSIVLHFGHMTPRTLIFFWTTFAVLNDPRAERFYVCCLS